MIDISDGIALFNECDFFSAHDYFEDIWMDADTNDKEFFQGLVQISVGCYHLICGNYKGAKSQLIKGMTKLEKYEPTYYKVNLSSLNMKINFLINNINSNSNITQEIPTIKLLN